MKRAIVITEDTDLANRVEEALLPADILVTGITHIFLKPQSRKYVDLLIVDEQIGDPYAFVREVKGVYAPHNEWFDLPALLLFTPPFDSLWVYQTRTPFDLFLQRDFDLDILRDYSKRLTAELSPDDEEELAKYRV